MKKYEILEKMPTLSKKRLRFIWELQDRNTVYTKQEKENSS